ncbi:protein KRTCAP2 homolog [Varroa jacobsoni]|uniref:Dolichyl-diphosphooligosaccharide--protein glycosyltransferase subunit KCP2 n=1 Tax=Varroa destructor TaxID=109461 RepID=A0A7M7KEK2_VARDE|nr:protein KRTCAP2 homolog [Varroa destructor]XP_022709337.1 protein KRTCAP2 homolog [Varroa jacobsoni]
MAESAVLMSSHWASGLMSTCLVVLLFASLQIFKAAFTQTRAMTVLGGYVGSWLFILLLTAVSNFEMAAFGSAFQSKLLPEVAGCLVLSLLLLAQIHRVCATTCALFSFVALYYLAAVSVKAYPGQQGSGGSLGVHEGRDRTSVRHYQYNKGNKRKGA